MSGSFSWHRLVSFDLWQCLGGVWGMSGRVWGVSGGCLRVSECYFWKSEALRCVLGSQPLQYGAISPFWHFPERHDFFAPDHSETSKYQNVYNWGWQKLLGYMISLFFSARQNDIKNGSCKWSPCSRAWRVPAIRPAPNFFFATRTRPELFFKISEFRVFPSRVFPSRPL